MGNTASVALHPSTFSAAAAVCQPVGVAAGVALGAAAAVCPPVGLAAVFGAGVALGAAFRVKATHHAAATDLDALSAVASSASTAAARCLRAVKNAACSAFDGATKRFAKKDSTTERSSAENKADEPPPAAAKREREMTAMGDMGHRAAQQAAGHDSWTAVTTGAASFDDVAGAGSCPWDSSADVFFSGANASELLATRAAWRASEVMAVLETLKPLEEKLGASIPREAKSCICVMAAAAGVCLDVFKQPPATGPVVWDAGLRSRGGAVAESWLHGHGTTSNRRRCSNFVDFSHM